MTPDLGGKRLELVKDLLPEAHRVAVLWNAANPYSALVFKETERAARTLEIELQSLEVQAPADFDGALDAATRQHTDALITVEDPLTIDHRTKIAEFAIDKRLPTRRREFTAGLLLAVAAPPLRAQDRAKQHQMAIVIPAGCTHRRHRKSLLASVLERTARTGRCRGPKP